MPLPLIPILILGANAAAGFAGSAIYDAITEESPPKMATPRDIDGVLAVLDACPISDPAMRRYREDLLVQVSASTLADVIERRPRMLIEAEKRCAAAVAASSAGRPDAGSGSGAGDPDTTTAAIPAPPEGAPSWYWLVFAALSALVLWRTLGGGGKRK